jgi:hypothetical protein
MSAAVRTLRIISDAASFVSCRASDKKIAGRFRAGDGEVPSMFPFTVWWRSVWQKRRLPLSCS